MPITELNDMLKALLTLMNIPLPTEVRDGVWQVPNGYKAVVKDLNKFLQKERFLKIDITAHAIATQHPEAVTALCRVQCDEIVRLRKAAYVEEVTAYHLLNWRDGTTYPKAPGVAIMDDIDARYPYPGAYR